MNILAEGMMNFDSFWSQYPRKDAKAHARIMWERLNENEKTLALEAIHHHVKMWKAENREKCHIPHAGTWLNPVLGRRWEDEIEIPQPKKIEVAWWGSESTILAKGREVGLEPRPGEGLEQFKGRIVERMRAAA